MTDPAEQLRRAFPDLAQQVEHIGEKLKDGDGKLELDKLAEQGERYRAAIEFVAWLEASGGVIAQRTPLGLVEMGVPSGSLAAAWLGIDLARIDEERREFIRQWFEETPDSKEL